MISLTFACGVTECVVTGSVVYGTEQIPERINQQRVDTVDGGAFVYDNGILRKNCILLIKNVAFGTESPLVDGAGFKKFISETLIFEKELFNIENIDANLDLGAGLGTDVIDCRYIGGNTLKEVFEHIAPGRFNIKFPYRIVG